MDNDVQTKVDQEETDKIDQSEQEKVVNNTEAEDNAVKLTEVDGGAVNGNDDVNSDVWELDDINEMQMARTEFLGGNNYNNNVSGAWGEWKQEGEETWRDWEFYSTYHHQDNDWVIDDLWVFEDHHFPDLVNDGDDTANPRHPPQA